MRQLAHEGLLLHHTVDRMARMLEAHVVSEERHWLSMNEWLDDWEKMCDERHQDNLRWGTGIMDMPTQVLAKASVGEAAQAQEVRKDE